MKQGINRFKNDRLNQIKKLCSNYANHANFLSCVDNYRRRFKIFCRAYSVNEQFFRRTKNML